MASLTLKNLPDDLLRALRKAADKDRRSVTQEIIHLLESALAGRAGRPVPRSPDADAQLAVWRKLAGKWESDVDRRRTVSAAEFKARCLALLDEVHETRETLVVTKRGKAVAKLVAVADEAERKPLRGSVRVKGDIVAPIGEPWDAMR